MIYPIRSFRLILASLLLSGVLSATAQTSSRVEAQQKKVQDITDQMMVIDTDIEKGVNRIVDLLASMADSTDSRTRVAQMKEDVLKGLKKNLDFYKMERQKRLGAAMQSYSSMPKDQLVKQVANIDGKVDERIDQIMKITESFTESKDIKKYEYHNNNWYGGGSSRTTNPDYKQNRMVATRGGNTADKVMDGLDKENEDLKRENDQLERRLPTAQSEEGKAALQAQIARNKATIDKNYSRMDELMSGGKQHTKQVGSKEAQNVEKRINDQIQDIRKAHNELVRLKSVRDTELMRLKSMSR